LIARQAQLNALLDLDKNDHQVAPEAEDTEPVSGIIRQIIPPPRPSPRPVPFANSMS
jgi:hypothetical protein